MENQPPPFISYKHSLSRLGMFSLTIPERNLTDLGISGLFPAEEAEVFLGLKSSSKLYLEKLPCLSFAVRVTGYSNVHYAG